MFPAAPERGTSRRNFPRSPCSRIWRWRLNQLASIPAGSRRRHVSRNTCLRRAGARSTPLCFTPVPRACLPWPLREQRTRASIKITSCGSGSDQIDLGYRLTETFETCRLARVTGRSFRVAGALRAPSRSHSVTHPEHSAERKRGTREHSVTAFSRSPRDTHAPASRVAARIGAREGNKADASNGGGYSTRQSPRGNWRFPMAHRR